MNTNKLLNNILGNIKKEQTIYKSKKKFNKFKPLKQKTIAGKPVQVFNKHPIPKKHIIKKAYKKIPDDLSIPLQFMTRKQYLKKYVKNQELQNGVMFDKQTKNTFFKNKKEHYGNIVGRYTTKSNPHYPPAVVVFNDPNNFKNIKGNKFDDLVFHEYGHELVEKQGMKMPLYKEEMFADHIADYGQDKKIFCDKRAKNYALKKLGNIKTDKCSKNMAFNLKAETEYPLFDYPRNFGRHRVVSYKNPKKILDVLAKQRGFSSTEDYVKGVKTTTGDSSETTVDEFKNLIKSKEKVIPPIAMERKPNGNLWVEGQHRLVAAYETNTKIPTVELLHGKASEASISEWRSMTKQQQNEYYNKQLDIKEDSEDEK